MGKLRLISVLLSVLGSLAAASATNCPSGGEGQLAYTAMDPISIPAAVDKLIAESVADSVSTWTTCSDYDVTLERACWQPLEKQGTKVGTTYWVEARLDCTDGVFEKGSTAMMVTTSVNDPLPIKPPPELVDISSKMLPACADRDLAEAGFAVFQLADLPADVGKMARDNIKRVVANSECKKFSDPKEQACSLYTEDGTDFWIDSYMECADGTARDKSVVQVQVTLGDPAAAGQAPYVKDLQIKLQPPPRSA